MSSVMQQEVIRRLRDFGGSDIQVVDGRIYELSLRELDLETVRQAVRNFIDQEQAHEIR
ncbi:hypothetical protein M8009_12905 [Halomonas sp. ATCH28]|uniref:Uncharacterized protein n=1 Tax=Halomonas gemina TaxID=2945105 RepID=A0ABT0T2N6_9GAMM|nr:hypothetical protein [Halomonas gemina]MCL7941185.1 hypothetical protein [Halomonas gemina]